MLLCQIGQAGPRHLEVAALAISGMAEIGLVLPFPDPRVKRRRRNRYHITTECQSNQTEERAACCPCLYVALAVAAIIGGYVASPLKFHPSRTNLAPPTCKPEPCCRKVWVLGRDRYVGGRSLATYATTCRDSYTRKLVAWSQMNSLPG